MISYPYIVRLPYDLIVMLSIARTQCVEIYFTLYLLYPFCEVNTIYYEDLREQSNSNKPCICNRLDVGQFLDSVSVRFEHFLFC
mgnify:CR=1 FL=1